MSNKPKVITEYFKREEENAKKTHYDEIFNPDNDNIDLQTDVNNDEIIYASILKTNDEYLKDKGISPVFKPYLDNLLRLKISKDRKSRAEYVDVNKSSKESEMEQMLNQVGMKK